MKVEDYEFIAARAEAYIDGSASALDILRDELQTRIGPNLTAADMVHEAEQSDANVTLVQEFMDVLGENVHDGSWYATGDEFSARALSKHLVYRHEKRPDGSYYFGYPKLMIGREAQSQHGNTGLLLAKKEYPVGGRVDSPKINSVRVRSRDLEAALQRADEDLTRPFTPEELGQYFDPRRKIYYVREGYRGGVRVRRDLIPIPLMSSRADGLGAIRERKNSFQLPALTDEVMMHYDVYMHLVGIAIDLDVGPQLLELIHKRGESLAEEPVDRYIEEA